MATKKYTLTEGEKDLISAFIKIQCNEKKIAVLSDRIFRNLPLQKIAKKYKISVSYVHLIEAEMVKLVRDAMNKEWKIRMKEYNKVKKI